jgi:glycosyltransferase involved in cell wall biosynthesis
VTSSPSSASFPLALSLDVSAVPTRPGGAGYYTIELARALCARDDIRLTMVSRVDDQDRWRALAGAEGTVVVAVPRSRPVRLVFEQVRLPRLIRSLGVELHHAPHYTMPERARVPCAVTIHDCIFFDHPEWHLHSKAVFFRRAIRQAARHAAVLVTGSEFTAARLRASCDVRAPIVVAPYGVDLDRFTPHEPAPGADHHLLTQLGVPTDRPLVVFVGTLEPRKGVASLVTAFDDVADRERDAVLVLGGGTGWGVDEIERALATARHADRILRTGYLSDAAVPALMRQSTTVVYPAVEEGYGLPALEALACGAPLVTTAGTAMAEMAGDAADLVTPGDHAMLVGALTAALEQGREGAAVEGRRARGLAVAAERTWEASAARHLEAYRVALTGPN